MLKSIKSSGVTAVLDHDGFNKRIRVVRYDGAIEKALPDIVAAAKEEDAEKIIVYAKQHDEPILAKQLFAPEGYLKGYYLAIRLVSWYVTFQKAGDRQILIQRNRRSSKPYIAQRPVFTTTVHPFLR